MSIYYVRFGSGDPRPYTGLSPTFLIFNYYGSAVTPPGITSVIGATGFYAFDYSATVSIAFLIDGATTGLSSNERYITGTVDPQESVTVDGIGSTASSFGTTNTDPSTVFGYLKRIQENLEGNMSFTKASGALSILSRGSSTLLATKTVTNSVSMVIKT